MVWLVFISVSSERIVGNSRPMWGPPQAKGGRRLPGTDGHFHKNVNEDDCKQGKKKTFSCLILSGDRDRQSTRLFPYMCSLSK